MSDGKSRLVIVDTDYDFLRNCEEEIIRKFAATTMIQEITDAGYVNAYFSEKQSIDLLLIDEESYGAFLKEHDIKRTFLMVSEVDVDKQYPDNVTVLLKYMPTQDIVQKIEDALTHPFVKSGEADVFAGESPTDAGNGQTDGKEKKKTKVIGVYSPIGGCGKSMVCVALARKLKKLDQKVLLVGCDATQSMSVFYPPNACAGKELAEKLVHPDEDTYWTILQNIGQDEVSYVLPFDKAPTTIGLGWPEMNVLITTLVSKQDFDVIILDVGSIMTREMSEHLDHAESLILVTETNEIAARKMQKLLQDPDLLPKCNCILIANEYKGDGMRLAKDSIFGTIAPYANWKDAIEDPIFYEIAMKIIE